MSECTSTPASKLIFACSGAADVGAVADQAARKLTREGAGKMFCLAGVGGRVEAVMKTTEAAQALLAIDGCSLDCVKHCLDEAGFTRYSHLRLSDLGMAKGQTAPTEENIRSVTEAATALLA